MKKLTILLIVISLAFNLALADEPLTTADSLYENRSEIFDSKTILADSANIDNAIKLYQKAAEQLPDEQKPEAIWKLLRAYYFKGTYTTDDKELKKQIYDNGKNLGVSNLEKYPESIGMNFWTAVLYGVWAEEYGKMKAAREGAAGKIRDYCEKTIKLDSLFADAGGYRILGRVHFKSPKIPLILGWPSKKKAVEYLEKAVALAPDNIMGKQYLAEALYNRGKKDRAISLIQEVIASDNNQIGIAETAKAKKDATEILEQWLKD